MDYFKVTYPAGSKLGMSIINRDDPSLPIFGNTMVDSVDPNGLSQKGGLEKGDFVLSVNGQYVAFDSNLDVVHLLQSLMTEHNELEIYFARPNSLEWSQIQRSMDAPIKEGMVNKLHQGLFKKWNRRNLRVTREVVDYSSDGVMKARYSVETEVGPPKVAAGYPSQQGVFEFRCGDKEFVLQTNSTHSRNTWMHAIDCALQKTFHKPLLGTHSTPGANISPNSPSSRAQHRPNGGARDVDDGMEAYLRIGRNALLNQAPVPGTLGGSQSGSSAPARPDPRGSPKATGGASGPSAYRVLSLAKLEVLSGPSNVVKLKDVRDPSRVTPSLIDYDFALEEKVLA
ncbi:PH domain-containing protein, partial [Durusdinium trenchii]